MRIGKKGSLWKWFWIAVVVALIMAGLYFLLRGSMDVGNITNLG